MRNYLGTVYSKQFVCSITASMELCSKENLHRLKVSLFMGKYFNRDVAQVKSDYILKKEET